MMGLHASFFALLLAACLGDAFLIPAQHRSFVPMLAAKAPAPRKAGGGSGRRGGTSSSQKPSPGKTPRSPRPKSGPGSAQPPADAYAYSSSSSSSSSTPPPLQQTVKSFTRQTVWGQNIINVRSFSLDSLKKFDFVGSFVDPKMAPVYPLPEVAFIGRSNVGKSSLLNCLTGSNKAVAVVSKTPGRTQCINLFKCADKDGDIAVLVDLPGYGFAKLAKTQQESISFFLQEYIQTRTPLRMVFVLVDVRREPQELDRQMLAFLEGEGMACTVVATKCDLLKPAERQRQLVLLRSAYGLPRGQPVVFSATTGEGRKEVWRKIRGGILGEDDEQEEEEEGEWEEEDEEGEGEEGTFQIEDLFKPPPKASKAPKAAPVPPTNATTAAAAAPTAASTASTAASTAPPANAANAAAAALGTGRSARIIGRLLSSRRGQDSGSE